jgi:hypothetical protein
MAIQDNAAGGVSGCYGARSSVAGAVRADRAVLPQTGNGRPPSGVEAAADLFLATVVQPVGSGNGGGLYDPLAMRGFVGIDTATTMPSIATAISTQISTRSSLPA